MIFWDLGLTLFDIPKDVIFAKILVLSNIFGFSAVDWAPKWTKLFDCINTPIVYNFVIFWGPVEVPFEPKFKTLNLDFSNTVFLLLEHYIWSKFQQD